MILIGDVVQTFALANLTLILASKGDRFGGRINAPICTIWAKPDVRVYHFLDLSFPLRS